MHANSNQVKRLTDEIMAGIQNGDMVVENIEARWDKGGQQRYILSVLDINRTAALTRWQQAISNMPSLSIPSPSAPLNQWPVSKEPDIQDLGTITEPITGFRDFYLGNGPYPWPGLISRNKAPWPMREPMRAFCKGNSLAAHDAPNLNCECGIYAFSSPEQDGLQLSGQVIWGEIAMWGEVLIAERGYRSEFAYPKTLFIQDTGTKAIKWLRDHLADGYGVPVFLVEKREGKTAAQVMGEMLAVMARE